ncbi:pyrroloquinoline quinone precursor peptide PqqA [Heyndrickxia vini]|uniref:Coenzyme PQQ synthesis protein A n=1 Tax=Heyndrickxia vini TaxID=1476025 RepID=A0ABX7E3U6_9BACI|nr:pyrroloquinoline quinone precursor peptide PqqA [Heyndrickxia vini]
MLVSSKVVNNMWVKPEYKEINTSSEVTMYAYIGK